MIDIDYKQLGLFRSKMVWFAEQLPSINGYHSIKCLCCYRKISYHFPFSQYKHHTTLIDLSLDTNRLFEQIRPKRRQKIKRAYKEEIKFKQQNLNYNLLKEFVNLYRKFQVPIGNYLTSPWSIKALQDNIKVFKGIQNDQTLIMDLVIHDGCTAYRWMRARNKAIKSEASTYIGGALIWEIIQYFKRNSYQTLDLGGHNYFKCTFGGDIVPVYNYSAILSPILKLIIKGKPFFSRLPGPLLKAIFRAKNLSSFSPQSSKKQGLEYPE